MPQQLPRLRVNLDFMRSPDPDRPGLVIRDALQFSDATIIIPPPLVDCLRFFDGEGTDLDLRQALVQITGELQVGELEEHLIGALSQAGFLDDEVYQELRDARLRAFTEAPARYPSHAGAAYPAEADELSALLAEYLDHDAPAASERNLIGIAAPHISLEGGRPCYRAAYGALRPQDQDRTFVILGTSHYGQPERFGLTRKPYVTPLGETVTDAALVDELVAKAGDAVILEDYCHAVEHSIEFQVLFLQHLFGANVRILPVLCGSFVQSLNGGGAPEDDPAVARFLGALREIAAREADRLFWVLGIDLAHIGPRYGDSFAAEAGQGMMTGIAKQDAERIERVLAGDAQGFWERVKQHNEDLRWCGASTLYTFLAAVPGVKGESLCYEQWNIDEQSAVSFAALAFTR
jgi:AmmeMemoRadiSam system protein B